MSIHLLGVPKVAETVQVPFFIPRVFFFRLSVLLFTPLKNDKTRESLFSLVDDKAEKV